MSDKPATHRADELLRELFEASDWNYTHSSSSTDWRLQAALHAARAYLNEKQPQINDAGKPDCASLGVVTQVETKGAAGTPTVPASPLQQTATRLTGEETAALLECGVNATPQDRQTAQPVACEPAKSAICQPNETAETPICQPNEAAVLRKRLRDFCIRDIDRKNGPGQYCRSCVDRLHAGAGSRGRQHADSTCTRGRLLAAGHDHTAMTSSRIGAREALAELVAACSHEHSPAANHWNRECPICLTLPMAAAALAEPEQGEVAALIERLRKMRGYTVFFPDVWNLADEAADMLARLQPAQKWAPLLDPPDEERALYDAAEYVETGGMPSPDQHMRLCKVALKLANAEPPHE